jgi:hypothetical protein
MAVVVLASASNSQDRDYDTRVVFPATGVDLLFPAIGIKFSNTGEARA